MLKVLLSLFGVAVLVFSCAAIVGPPKESPEAFAKRKEVCAAALMSSIGHSTTGYADKVAYDKVVSEKCAGLEINGVALDRR